MWAVTAAQLKRAHDLLWAAYEEADHTLFSRVQEPNALRDAGQATDVWEPDDADLAPGALMLLGLSLENLAKGALIRKRPELATATGMCRWPVPAHDTSLLLKEAEIPLDSAEADLIARLVEFVLWAGRYPVPTIFARSAPRRIAGGGTAPFPWFSRRDKDVAELLYRRLYEDVTAD